MALINDINFTGFKSINLVTFTTGGTYTPPGNLLYAHVECVGAGGGGAGAGSSGQLSNGGGGGAEYRASYLTAASIGASQTVTIGSGGAAGTPIAAGSAGGSTSFGSLVIANGGGGGNITYTSAAGGAGGSGGTGNINVPGQNGTAGYGPNVFGSLATPQRSGGASFYGSGGRVRLLTATGEAGQLYGGGGASGSTNNNNVNGGAGGAGVVIITEYLSA